jgi:hypothetical protein
MVGLKAVIDLAPGLPPSEGGGATVRAVRPLCVRTGYLAASADGGGRWHVAARLFLTGVLKDKEAPALR